MSETEPQEDSPLHPLHRFPRAVLLLFRGSHFAALKRLQEGFEGRLRIGRKRLPRGSREQRIDPVREVLAPRLVALRHSAPAFSRLSRTASSCFAASGTRGSRSTFSIRPIIASPAFTGSGFDST